MSEFNDNGTVDTNSRTLKDLRKDADRFFKLNDALRSEAIAADVAKQSKARPERRDIHTGRFDNVSNAPIRNRGEVVAYAKPNLPGQPLSTETRSVSLGREEMVYSPPTGTRPLRPDADNAMRTVASRWFTPKAAEPRRYRKGKGKRTETFRRAK